MYLINLLVILLLLISPAIQPAYGEINNIFESITKVDAGNSLGSGNCINIDSKYVYILTNAHVVGNDSVVKVKFYKKGYESIDFPATVIWKLYKRNEPLDMALLTVDRSLLKFTPKVIKFDFDHIYKEKDTTLTIGCPEGEWPRAYNGHIVDAGGGTFRITPTVIPGQSGSALLNHDGTKAIGLIAWQEGNYGKAMTAETIKKGILGESTNYYFKQPYNHADTPRIPLMVGYPVGCRNPRQNGPFNRVPPNQQPLSPDYQTQPDNPEGGNKIFPDYPGSPDDEFVPENPEDTNPVTPPVPDVKITELTTRIDAVEKGLVDVKKLAEDALLKANAVDTRLSAVDTRLTAMEEPFNNLRNKLDPKVDQIDQKIKDLEKAINLKPNKEDVIVPGKLDEIMAEKLNNVITPGDLNNVTKDINKDQKIVVDEIVKLNESLKNTNARIDSTLSKQPDVLKDIATILVSANKETTSNTYFDTATNVGIPSSVLLIIAWLYKSVLSKYLNGPSGGTATTVPFPKTTGIKP